MESNLSIRTDFTKNKKKAIEYCAIQCNLKDPQQISEEVFDVFIQSCNTTQDFLFPGVISTLDLLKKRGFTIGSLSKWKCRHNSNGTLESFLSILEAPGSRTRPPFQLAFDLAKEHCEGLVSPGQVLHVGDSLYSDIPAKIWVPYGMGEDGRGWRDRTCARRGRF